MEELAALGVKNLQSTAISFFDRDLKYNIFCGIYPNLYKVSINLKSIEDQKIGQFEITYELAINSRFIPNQLQPGKIRMEIGEEQLSQQHEEENHINASKTARRSKERKLGVIIEKVYIWRKLYCGYYDESKGFIKLTLEDAAEKVGISKKSLDDYLNQLK